MDMTISIPDTLNVSNSEKYILSIRLRSDGLSFSVYNPQETGSLFYRECDFGRTPSFMDNLKDFFFENELLSYSFKKTYILCESAPYTIVPEKIIEEGKAKEFLNFTSSRPSSRTLTNTLQNTPAAIVFGIEEEIYEFCCRSLLTPSFIHSLTPLLSYWRKISLENSRKQLFTHIHGKQLDIACFEKGSLVFINTFQFEHVNDILYYILYVWRQLELDQQNDPLHISGKADLRIRITETLHTYIRYVMATNMPSEVYLWGAEAIQAPLDLLTLLICE